MEAIANPSEERAIPTCVGTTDMGLLVRLRKRAIPTCVGTTGAATHPAPMPPGHPHVRGDYDVLDLVDEEEFGPSPRAWGLRPWPPGPGRSASGHPHVRGDYGGAPRGGPAYGRAIPTCVGTTGPGARAHAGGPGHPHVRGDYGGELRQAHPRAPGHPHVRGDYRVAAPHPPAPSGHPHVRGDYTRWTRALGSCSGPSPRAWGLHLTRTAKMPVCPPLCVFSGEVPGRGFQVPPRRGKG